MQNLFFRDISPKKQVAELFFYYYEFRQNVPFDKMSYLRLP